MMMKGSWTGTLRIGSFLLMSVLVALTGNCGKSKKGIEPEITAEELSNEGWRLFETQEFLDAKAKFSEAIAKDTAYPDAYNGRGWCNAFLDLEDEAASDFNAANVKGLSQADAYVGLAAIYVGNREFQSAIASAKAALSMDSAYQFSHETSIDYLDIHLILAQAYYGLGGGYLDSAQQEVDYLNPANDLNSTDPMTWVVEGITYPTYPEALLKEIQRLEESIGPS
jgi:tetratricopeptide (TPR) repeat protein